MDKDKWTAVPHDFNCGYEPQTNSIYILGTAIGHEISHAFDRTGAKFDKDGNMKNWWTQEDRGSLRGYGRDECLLQDRR